MILSEKIVLMRKKAGWSQEELAEQLKVSRQSVSKWELGASIPDLDKILRLSKLFGVSTDYLLKDEEEEILYLNGHDDEPGIRQVTMEEANTYMSLVRKTAHRFANAISLLIMSPAMLVVLLAISKYKNGIKENTAAGIGMTILLLIVSIGVAVIIYNGLKLKKYEYLEEEIISLEYGISGIVEKEKAEIEGKSRLSVTAGIVLCIIGIIPLLLMGVLTGDDFKTLCCVALLLLFVATGVNLFVRTEMINNCFSKLLQSDDYSVHNKKIIKNANVVGGVYWPVVVAVFLGYSLLAGNWQTSWILWPVAGILYVAVSRVVSIIGKNK